MELSTSELELGITIGVHPTESNEYRDIGEEAVNARLETLIEEGKRLGKVLAIGECGLDYDRLHFCEKSWQMKGFLHHIALAEKHNLPMFLHNRNTEGDFLSIVQENRSRIKAGGVVHSFDGTLEEMHALVDLGFFIGINGCSLRTEENLKVASEIPEEFILLETDAPWCGVKATHAGFPHLTTTFPVKKPEKYEIGSIVKDRSEPCMIVHVLEILSAIRGVDSNLLAEAIYQNTERLFYGK
jgi:TatD DNase family protein